MHEREEGRKWDCGREAMGGGGGMDEHRKTSVIAAKADEGHLDTGVKEEGRNEERISGEKMKEREGRQCSEETTDPCYLLPGMDRNGGNVTNHRPSP